MFNLIEMYNNNETLNKIKPILELSLIAITIGSFIVTTISVLVLKINFDTGEYLSVLFFLISIVVVCYVIRKKKRLRIKSMSFALIISLFSNILLSIFLHRINELSREKTQKISEEAHCTGILAESLYNIGEENNKLIDERTERNETIKKLRDIIQNPTEKDKIELLLLKDRQTSYDQLFDILPIKTDISEIRFIIAELNRKQMIDDPEDLFMIYKINNQIAESFQEILSKYNQKRILGNTTIKVSTAPDRPSFLTEACKIGAKYEASFVVWGRAEPFQSGGYNVWLRITVVKDIITKYILDKDRELAKEVDDFGEFNTFIENEYDLESACLFLLDIAAVEKALLEDIDKAEAELGAWEEKYLNKQDISENIKWCIRLQRSRLRLNIALEDDQDIELLDKAKAELDSCLVYFQPVNRKKKYALTLYYLAKYYKARNEFEDSYKFIEKAILTDPAELEYFQFQISLITTLNSSLNYGNKYSKNSAFIIYKAKVSELGNIQEKEFLLDKAKDIYGG